MVKRLGASGGSQNDGGMMGPVVRILWDESADRSVALPGYETSGAAGADIRANFPSGDRASGFVLQPMQRAIVPTGIRVEIPVGFEIQIRPRSGLAFKHGLTLVNTPGTIDSDYRGLVGVLMINLGAQPFTIRHGERIAQLIVAPVVQARFEAGDTLSDTGRGAGGFGSTGTT
jgi:dUTP pyrophosphatase